MNRRQPKRKPANPPNDPREKYPVIPLPHRRRGHRPEIHRPEIPRGESARGSWAKRIAVGLLWCVVLALAAGAVLRVFLHDFWTPLIWWNSFTLYVYLPIYVCLVLALAMRRWRLAGLAAAVAACHLIWIAPDFLPPGFFASAQEGGRIAENRPSDAPFRLYYQNLNMHTVDFQQRIDAILAEDPDFMALVELAPEWEEAVRQSAIFADYPHNTLREKPARSQQLAIFSKTPLEEVEHRYILGRRLATAATVQVDGRPVRLFCIHAPRPLEENAEQYRDYCREVVDWISQTQQPRVVVGDFNATQHAAWYQRMLSRADLHSAHREAGRGYAVTWPNGQFLMPPIRIDHVLLSPELTCQIIREGSGGQSDHKPLICDLTLASGRTEEEDGGSGD